MTNRKSIDPVVWGDGFWKSIHYASVDYAVADKEGFRAFFASLKVTLPCENCREHYTEFWNTHSIEPYLEQDEKLREWTLLLHNTVNKRLGKPIWTLAEFNERYDVREDDEEEKVAQISLITRDKPVVVHAAPVSVPAPRNLQRPRIQIQTPNYVHVGNGKRVRPTAAPPGPKKKCKNCGKKGGP